MTKFVKLPTEVEAIRFQRGNFHDVWALTGVRRTKDSLERRNFNIIGTYLLQPDESVVAELWSERNNRWVGVKDGWWIIRDSQGNLSTCNDLEFREIYAAVDENAIPLTFEEDLTSLLNRHSMENASGTPDYILCAFLKGVLEQYDRAVMERANWRDESVDPPALVAQRNPELEGSEEYDAASVEGPVLTPDEIREQLGMQRNSMMEDELKETDDD